MIKYCIFDLDGVLVDTARYHYQAWRVVALELGIPFTQDDNERLKGVSRMDSLDILLSMADVKLSLGEKEAIARHKNEIYKKQIEQLTPDDILPGALDLLRYLREEKYQIALGSASKNAPFILKQLHLLQFFDAIVDGNVVQEAKPSPAVFLTAAKMMHAPAEQCVVFEDAAAGIEAAHRADMTSIGVGEAKHLSQANFVVPDLGDWQHVVEIINQLNQQP